MTGCLGNLPLPRTLVNPATALIFSSACLEKNLALTMTGCLGNLPLPRTLVNPALDTSITGAFLASPAYLTLVCSDTRLHSLSRLTAGCQRFELLEWTWKFLIPTLPKYPGWYLSKLILW